MDYDSIISIYVTHENMDEARKIAKVLLDEKLVACVNYFPINSEYVWNGEIKNENEIVTLFKTVNTNWSYIKDKIESMHPYDTPAILMYSVYANSKYAKWINDSVIAI